LYRPVKPGRRSAFEIVFLGEGRVVTGIGHSIDMSALRLRERVEGSEGPPLMGGPGPCCYEPDSVIAADSVQSLENCAFRLLAGFAEVTRQKYVVATAGDTETPVSVVATPLVTVPSAKIIGRFVFEPIEPVPFLFVSALHAASVAYR
jgi:hypothetical protein